jgi:hypothetical protein
VRTRADGAVPQDRARGASSLTTARRPGRICHIQRKTSARDHCCATAPACAAPPAPAARRAAWVACGARPARRPTALTSRWQGGVAEENFQGGQGRETGRRWWVGSREKWLYFSYTPASDKCSRIIRRLEGHDQAVEMPLSQSRTRDRTRSARRRGTGASGRPRCGQGPALPNTPRAAGRRRV